MKYCGSAAMIVYRTDLQIAVPHAAHTLDGFREWYPAQELPKHASVSLIDGEVLFDMSPERIESHGQVKIEITSVLRYLIKKATLGRCYPDRTWITNDDAGLSTEPDCAFATWETLKSGRLKIIPLSDKPADGIEMRGSPDWVLEIISPTSFRKDAELLPGGYYHAGVKEFWLVDARETLEFNIFVRGDNGFELVEPQDGWKASRVFERQFRLTREIDLSGGWDYTLQVR
jgi:Uma2 family endonuclease